MDCRVPIWSSSFIYCGRVITKRNRSLTILTKGYRRELSLDLQAEWSARALRHSSIIHASADRKVKGVMEHTMHRAAQVTAFLVRLD